ncbi:hypothetical protein V5799_015771 [Amblyomma americanum]|uniref:Uncharacterized protein n=1 Tax=Amblyomma americanum TaxID=6943 RepID=A0AAQ4F8E7_AMBAM
MVAVVDHLLTAAVPLNSDHGAAEHLRMLQKCVDGEEEAMDFALACGHSTWSNDPDLICPDHYPVLPRTVAEKIFKADNTTRAEEFVSRIERQALPFSPLLEAAALIINSLLLN